jgi:predicted Zn-dependent protease
MARSSFAVSKSGSVLGWQRLRLTLLLGFLAVLSLYAWRTWQFNRSIQTSHKQLQQEENCKAIKTLQENKSRFGDSARVRLLLAQAYRHMGQKDSFERQLDIAQALGLSSETVQGEKFLFEAQLGLLASPETQIADYISTSMESNGHDFDDTARALVFGLLRNQDFEAVQRFLLLWETHSQNAPWIPTFRGMLHLARRDWKNALGELEPALKKHPEFLPLFLQSGIAYQGDQQFELAEAMLDRYLQSQPDSADALLRYSEVLRKQGKASLALERIDQILRSSGSQANSIQPALRLQIAKLYLDDDENHKVIETLDGLAKLWPEDVELASTLSQAYQRLGDEQRSASYAAIADAGQKETGLADRMFFELLSNPNRTPQQCFDLGHLLLHKQSRENGIYWLEAALKLDENFIPAHRDLALYYDRTDQPLLAAVHKRYFNSPSKP